jgi:hypothetical protein
MNFKNISLLALLLVAGFVGTFSHAGDDDTLDDFAMHMKYRYESLKEGALLRELSALDQSLEEYQTFADELVALCAAGKRESGENISEVSIKACAYFEDIKAIVTRLEEQRKSLENAIKGLQNEIYGIKDELGLPYAISGETKSQEDLDLENIDMD